mmetsp:Transcript_45915/g.109354  ORF Transcript_45915/g.109354 Transcript_45915/m.109354 type:complete len:391 (-) Transcript_45915:81-1253(-)
MAALLPSIQLCALLALLSPCHGISHGDVLPKHDGHHHHHRHEAALEAEVAAAAVRAAAAEAAPKLQVQVQPDGAWSLLDATISEDGEASGFYPPGSSAVEEASSATANLKDGSRLLRRNLQEGGGEAPQVVTGAAAAAAAEQPTSTNYFGSGPGSTADALEKAGFSSKDASALLSLADALDPAHAQDSDFSAGTSHHAQAQPMAATPNAALDSQLASFIKQELVNDQAPTTAAKPAPVAAAPAAAAAAPATAAAAPGAAAPGAAAAVTTTLLPVNGTATGEAGAATMVVGVLAAACCCCTCAVAGVFMFLQRQGGDLTVRPSLYSAQRAQRAAARASDRSGAGQTGSDRDLGNDDPSAALSDGSRSGGSRYAARRGQRSGNEATPAERSF